MASGPPRVGLVLADSAVALVLFLVWTGDPVYVLFQVGAAALAGALLGLHGIPLWGGRRCRPRPPAGWSFPTRSLPR